MALFDFSLGDIGETVKSIREAITGEAIKDPQKMAEITLELEKLENSLRLGQIEINKAEAQHSSVFVAGARPFIIWVCGFALAYQFVLHPLLFGLFATLNIDFPIPPLETGQLISLMVGMLGLGAYRSYDKLKGTDTKRIG